MTGTRRPAVGDHANAVKSNDVAEIRADIVEARAELGDTVEALAAKADVKGRAKDAAETAKARVAETAEVAKARVTETVTTGAHLVQDRAADLTEKAKADPRVQQVVTQVSDLTEKAKADPRVQRVVTEVRQRPVPIAAVAAAVLLVVVGVVARRRRNR